MKVRINRPGHFEKVIKIEDNLAGIDICKVDYNKLGTNNFHLDFFYQKKWMNGIHRILPKTIGTHRL